MKQTRAESPAVNLELILQPETSLERLILKDKPFRRGLLWNLQHGSRRLDPVGRSRRDT